MLMFAEFFKEKKEQKININLNKNAYEKPVGGINLVHT